MTNAEMIRQMTDEELIDLLVWGSGVPECDEGCHHFGSGCALKCPHDRREKSVRKWLEREAE